MFVNYLFILLFKTGTNYNFICGFQWHVTYVYPFLNIARCTENNSFFSELVKYLLSITKWMTRCELNGNCMGNKTSISVMGGFFIEVRGVRLSLPTTIKGAGGAFEIGLAQNTYVLTIVYRFSKHNPLIFKFGRVGRGEGRVKNLYPLSRKALDIKTIFRFCSHPPSL